MLFADGKLTGVLDWGSARFGSPEMDVGLLCGYARCGSYPASIGSTPPQQAVDRLIAAYERHRALDEGRLLFFETEFLVSVLVDMTDRYIRRRAGEVVPGNPLLDDPNALDLVRARLEAVLCIRVPTPEEAAI